jgi:predicted metalloendopeptidase
VVRQPDYLSAFAALWSRRPGPLEGLGPLALIHGRAAMLTDDWWPRTSLLRPLLSGTEVIRERWKRGVHWSRT